MIQILESGLRTLNSSNFLYEELLLRSKATNPGLYPLFLAQNRIIPDDIKGLEPIYIGTPMEGTILIGRDGINLVKTVGVYKTLQSMVRMLVAKDGNQMVLDIYSDKVTAGIRMDSSKLYEKTKPSRTARLLALAENGYEILGWVYLEFDQVPEYLQK